MSAIVAFLGVRGTVVAGIALALALAAGVQTARLWKLQAETADAGAAVLEEASERDSESLEVAAETKEQAEADVAEVQTDSNERKEIIRVVYRDLPPVDPVCPVALPERVHDTLTDAASAANRADL